MDADIVLARVSRCQLPLLRIATFLEAGQPDEVEDVDHVAQRHVADRIDDDGGVALDAGDRGQRPPQLGERADRRVVDLPRGATGPGQHADDDPVEVGLGGGGKFAVPGPLPLD